MPKSLLSLTLAAFTIAGAAQAEVPSVTADIAPVHSLVARVMGGVGAPSLIVPAGASPHAYALRPSEARAVQDADLIFWIGPALTPRLGDTLATLAPDARTVPLLEAAGTRELDVREDVRFAAHEHGEDHAQEAATEEHHHGDHTDTHDDHHDHADEAHDPHAWLDPMNAKVWLDAIAADLAEVDPDNAETYLANAAAGNDELDALVAEINDTLAPVRDRNFIVFHDAYQYFETSFGFPAAGAISLSDAAKPSPARIAEIHARVSEANVTCVLGEPQFNPALVQTVLDGTRAQTGVLDPLGSDLDLGPALYPALLRALAQTLADCL